MQIVPLGIVVHDEKVLLIHRRFPPIVWSPPGGYTEKNETLHETVKREIYEECGIMCKVIDKINQFRTCNTHIIVFACEYISGSLRCSYESKDLGWFKLDELPEPLSPEKSVFIKALDTIKKKY